MIATSMPSASAQSMKRSGAGIKAEISHIDAVIENPSEYLFANGRAAGILRPARTYSITRRPLIAAYEMAKLKDVSPRAP